MEVLIAYHGTLVPVEESSTTSRCGHCHAGLGKVTWRESDVTALKISQPASANRKRLGGVDMPVGHAADRLARQSRDVEIFDLVGLRVEQIEHVELQPYFAVEPVAGAGVEDQ